MRRFYLGNEGNHEEEDDDEDGDFDESKFMMPGPSEFITMTGFDNVDQQLLSCSIKICEGSFFWRFKGIESRLNMVEKVFERLKKLTEGDFDAEIRDAM